MSALKNLIDLRNALINLRKDHKLSQNELAKKVGVSRDLISRMEKGDNVGIHHILKVLAVFNKMLALEDNAIEINLDENNEKRFGQDLSKKTGHDAKDNYTNGIFNLANPQDMKVDWKKVTKI